MNSNLTILSPTEKKKRQAFSYELSELFKSGQKISHKALKDKLSPIKLELINHKSISQNLDTDGEHCADHISNHEN